MRQKIKRVARTITATAASITMVTTTSIVELAVSAMVYKVVKKVL